MNIAHQWRQPLNSIASGIGLADCQRGDSREDATRRAEEIMLSLKSFPVQSKRCAACANRSAAVNGFFPSEAVRQAISVMTDACAVQGIRLSCSLQEEKSLVGIQADLVQCLLNIFTNARDAITARGCREGAIVVELRLTAEQRQEIRVRDNGGGIDDEVLPIVFDPYVTTKFRAQGVGLGLFVARQIIEQRFGGAIAAGNRGDGAEIVITI